MISCFYCESLAEYLCDFGMDGGTCDRPLCDSHRCQTGVVFLSGPDAGVDTIDLCPGHTPVPNGHKPRPSRVGGGRAA